MFKVNNKNTRVTSMMHFSSVSIVDFEQVNVSSDVSEKTDLPNNFQISRSSYYFDIISQLWSFLARKSQDKKTFSTKDLPLIKKNQPLHTKKTIFLFKGFVRTPLPPDRSFDIYYHNFPLGTYLKHFIDAYRCVC